MWIDLCSYYAEIDPELFQVPQDEGLAKSFEQDLAQPLPADASWLVAEVGDCVVGWIYAQIFPPQDDARWQLLRELGKSRLVLEALGVERNYQRRGIATQLVRAVEQWAVNLGAELVFVDTYIKSSLSVPFYEVGLGYQRQSLRLRKEFS